jgi:methionyl-tRNA formyltransferase
MRLVFFGTAGFARPALAALAGRHDVALVVTQPDRPAGRGGQPRQPPVKSAAREFGLPVIQPERINARETVDRLIEAQPDAIVVAAYGQILRDRVFTIPPRGTINIHASLLPAYRGAAPVQWAIVRSERTTGITTFLIDAGMDTGDVLLRRALAIGPDETAPELERRLAELGASVILETLDGIDSGLLTSSPQPDEGVSYAPILTRDDGRIDWTLTATKVHDLVRGTSPWPGAWTTLRGGRIKVHRSARTGILKGAIPPGGIAPVETGRLLVGCSDELVELLEVQREGRPRVEGAAFLNGLRGADRFG